MDKSEQSWTRWTTAIMATLSFGLGRSTAVPMAELLSSLIWWIPFVVTVAGAASWQYLLGRMGEPAEEDSIPAVRTGDKTYLSGLQTAPFTIDECSTLLVSPRKGGSVRLPDVRAVTFVEFARVGWQVNFASSKMSGMILRDGLKTRITKNGNLKQWTDYMAQAGLIRKIKGGPVETLLPLNRLLEHILPTPLPAGWRGWNGVQVRS
jgi:hypothetical protein